MSATNSTPTINLPLFIGTDKPAWLVDWNGAMNAIDSAIATLQTAETGTATALSALSNSVTTLSNTVSQQTTAIETVTQNVNQLAGNVTTINGNINTINSLIGNGEPTTTDKTIIGAINEINAKIPEGGDVAADDVTYDNTDSGLTATDVQAAIDELKGDIDDIIIPTAGDDLGTAVDITTYNAISNMYTFPSDGYVDISTGTSTTSGIVGHLCGSNAVDTSSPSAQFVVASGAQYQHNSLFVHKGMKFYCVETGGAGAGCSAKFYPLV